MRFCSSYTGGMAIKKVTVRIEEDLWESFKDRAMEETGNVQNHLNTVLADYMSGELGGGDMSIPEALMWNVRLEIKATEGHLIKSASDREYVIRALREFTRRSSARHLALPKAA